MSAPRHMPPALRFLLAARRSELRTLQTLARTCDLVVAVSELVHALQKERGYSNYHLCSGQDHAHANLSGLRDESEAVESRFRAQLDTLTAEPDTGHGRARLLNCIAHALFRLDDLRTLRRQVQDRQVPVEDADARFTQIIAGLLAIVFEAADSALDPGVTGILVALLNFMQGKELSGQERACGVIAFTAGCFSDAQKARMLGLAALQARSFGVFSDYAQDPALSAWSDVQQLTGPVLHLRDMAQRTNSSARVDGQLAEIWYELCTARIDAMRRVEHQLAQSLAERCAQGMAEIGREMDDHTLLLARYADHASGHHPSVVFSVQSRIVDVPPEDGVSDDMTRPILDMMREQTVRLQKADAALAEVRGALDEKKQIDRAKALLMGRYQLAEQDAHERMQRAAMNGGLSVGAIARQIIDESNGRLENMR